MGNSKSVSPYESIPTRTIEIGTYRHYTGQYIRVLGFIKDFHTKQDLVVFQNITEEEAKTTSYTDSTTLYFLHESLKHLLARPLKEMLGTTTLHDGRKVVEYGKVKW